MVQAQVKAKAAAIIRQLKKLYPQARIALRFSNAWELLVATILSAQAQDKRVNLVAAELFKKYKAFDSYLKVQPAVFEKDISSINFYKTKAKNILALAKALKDKHQGGVPKSIEELVQLPGIGRKTANVVLSNSLGIDQGVVVDTHVGRLANLWGLTRNHDPVKIEQDLMLLLPQKEWKDFSLRTIAYGREYCQAKPHEHRRCPIQ